LEIFERKDKMSIRSMQQGSENGGSPDENGSKGSGVSPEQKQIQPGKTHNAVDGLITADGNQHPGKTAIYEKKSTGDDSSKPCTDQINILPDCDPDSRSPIEDSARNDEKRKSKHRKDEVGQNVMAPDETNDGQNPGDARGAGGGTNKKDPLVILKDIPNTHGDTSPQHSQGSIDDGATQMGDIKGLNR
jgi:hypothetical protein